MRQILRWTLGLAVFFTAAATAREPNQLDCRGSAPKSQLSYATSSFAGVPVLSWRRDAASGSPATSIHLSGPELQLKSSPRGFTLQARRSSQNLDLTLFLPRMGVGEKALQVAAVLVEQRERQDKPKVGTQSTVRSHALTCTARWVVF